MTAAFSVVVPFKPVFINCALTFMFRGEIQVEIHILGNFVKKKIFIIYHTNQGRSMELRF